LQVPEEHVRAHRKQRGTLLAARTAHGTKQAFYRGLAVSRRKRREEFIAYRGWRPRLHRTLPSGPACNL
jgi:hypothetical protein